MAMQIVGLVLAAFALAVAVLTLIPAFRSLRVANESLVAAMKAIDLTQADIDNSHHDVRWVVHRLQGNVVLLNASETSAAYNVEVDLRLDAEEQVATVALVDPLKSVQIPFPVAATTNKHELGEIDRISQLKPDLSELRERYGSNPVELFKRAAEKIQAARDTHQEAMQNHLLRGEVRWTTKYLIPRRQVIHEVGPLSTSTVVP